MATMAGVLQALAVPPLLGRWLDASDEDPNGAVTRAADLRLLAAAVRRRSESVVGRNLTVNAESAEIVGVMPPGFRVVDTQADLITPMRFDRASG